MVQRKNRLLDEDVFKDYKKYCNQLASLYLVR